MIIDTFVYGCYIAFGAMLISFLMMSKFSQKINQKWNKIIMQVSFIIYLIGVILIFMNTSIDTNNLSNYLIDIKKYITK